MKAVLLFVLGLLVGACTQSAKAPETSPDLPALAQDLAAKTVALVHTKEDGSLRSYCSGVWVRDDVFVTALHCLGGEGPSLDYIVGGDTVARPALPVKFDPDHDLALVKVPRPAPVHRTARVAATVRTGEPAFTMGHPLDLKWSFSSGLVSGIRKIDLDPETWYVQTTAPTSRGNSGCGLFDESGELLGIAHAGMPKGSNLAFYVHGMFVANLLNAK